MKESFKKKFHHTLSEIYTNAVAHENKLYARRNFLQHEKEKELETPRGSQGALLYSPRQELTATGIGKQYRTLKAVFRVILVLL